MKNTILHYSVGPLLYCPGSRETIAQSVISQKLGADFSLALCLEDTINDALVAEAEHSLAASLKKIAGALEQNSFYLPKIFIRVRSPEQILRLPGLFGHGMDLVSGFIIPKISLENADLYIQNMISINEHSKKTLYMMPIFESPSIVDLRSRFDILYTLKDKLAQAEDLILNIRVGGNDLCNLFGFRRHAHESIHKICPVSQIFSDIVTVYGMDYVISGPVWEYFDGPGWDDGLRSEIEDDKLCGFTGKTVIHPKQIKIVNQSLRVSRKDYENASAIVNWDDAAPSYVSADLGRERMDEKKTHINWARQTLLKAEAFGIKD